jgi:hypothetical protein
VFIESAEKYNSELELEYLCNSIVVIGFICIFCGERILRTKVMHNKLHVFLFESAKV